MRALVLAHGARRRDPEMRIFREETFGPVTSVMRAKDPEEALALCNDNEYGLPPPC